MTKTSGSKSKKATKDSDNNEILTETDTENELNIEETYAITKPELKLADKKLYDLDFMAQITFLKDDLQILYVNNNYLSSIDILNRIQSLKKINAGHNYIASINLTLANLTELDLRNNTLTRLPFFSKLPSLKILNVKSNKIEDVTSNFDTGKESKIEKLNLSFNLIQFKSKIDAKKFADNVNHFKNLRVLNLEHNKITDLHMLSI